MIELTLVAVFCATATAQFGFNLFGGGGGYNPYGGGGYGGYGGYTQQVPVQIREYTLIK